ncbi:MAG TPA: ABC transporter permease [Lacisediminihabitans sp.]|uniref:ABC transporter permease n=1 Tax=Lacisediminihabitans sp. TaxID=2787631 RepID=UPI002EDA7DD0
MSAVDPETPTISTLLDRDPILRTTRRFRAPFRGNVGLWIGVGMLAVVVISAVAAPLIDPVNPLTQDLFTIALPPGVSAAHPLGTDQLGRDILSRLLRGGELPLFIGALSVVVGGVFGTLLGLIAGYFGGWVDQVFSRLSDSQLALPSILIAITILTFAGRSTSNLIIVIALGGWPTYYRICRAQALRLRDMPFVDAAVSAGAGPIRIVLRQLLPSILGVVVVTATLDFSRSVLMASGLTFLGLGVQPPTADWGLMVAEGEPYLATAWWISTLPGIATVLVVFSVNLIGDRLIVANRR